MAYCTAAEVRSAIDFPSSGAPIEDADITVFITQSQNEVENIYKTKFNSTEDSGTASAGAASTLTDSSKTFTVDAFANLVLKITGGTGSGQYRKISSNTTTVITVSAVWTTNPDATSTYEVQTVGYKDETVDGDGTTTHFTKFFPLINLNTLTIDSTSITTTNVYQYTDSGRLVLKTNAEATVFSNTLPQLIDLTYIYGVDELPAIIKRLCIILAAIRTLTAQTAGTYDDFTSISLPGLTGSKGEPFTNIREAIVKFQSEAKAIISVPQGDQIEARGWNSYVPYTVFG